MVSYKIRWRLSTKKDLRKITEKDLVRIIKVVESLAFNSCPSGAIKLKGSEHAYRLRVGNYRVIYEVFDDEIIIEIVKVAHRREVYR